MPARLTIIYYFGVPARLIAKRCGQMGQRVPGTEMSSIIRTRLKKNKKLKTKMNWFSSRDSLSSLKVNHFVDKATIDRKN